MKMVEYSRLGTTIECNDVIGVLLELDKEYGIATLYNRQQGLVSFGIDEEMEVKVLRYELDIEAMVEGQAEQVLTLISEGWYANGDRYFNLTPYIIRLESLVKLRNTLAADC